MTDPGIYTIDPVKEVQNIDIILITHEHADHFHVESIREVLKNNSRAVVVSNSAVAALLAEKGIACQVVGDGQSTEIAGITMEGFGKDHAPIYGTIGLVENTGYLVANKFYFAGDSFYIPNKAVDVLALPLAGPWLKLSEVIDFAKKIKARIAFPVHDGMLVPTVDGGFAAVIIKNVLSPDGTEFVHLNLGETKEF